MFEQFIEQLYETFLRATARTQSRTLSIQPFYESCASNHVTNPSRRKNSHPSSALHVVRDPGRKTFGFHVFLRPPLLFVTNSVSNAKHRTKSRILSIEPCIIRSVFLQRRKIPHRVVKVCPKVDDLALYTPYLKYALDSCNATHASNGGVQTCCTLSVCCFSLSLCLYVKMMVRIVSS